MNSDRALELAREAYPHNHVLRVAFMLGCNKGYEQAENDLALTWEDMKLIHEISEDFWEPKWCDDKDKEKAGYEKVLRKFNKQRNK